VRSLRISKRAILLMLLFIGSILVLLPDRPEEALYILVPILGTIWICSYCIIGVWKKDREIPILDIGVLCVIFTTLYSLVPLLNFYFGGLEFGLLSDARLRMHQPSPQELGLFFGNHIAYLAALAFGYLFFRRPNGPPLDCKVSPVKPLTVNVLVSFFLILSLYFAVLRYGFGIGFKSGYDIESTLSSGPVWLAQINGKLLEIKFTFQAAVVAYLVLRKDDAWIRYFLFLLIAGNIADAFINPGSRGELMSLLLLTFLFWHKFHGAPWKFTLIFLPTAFTAFMFLGLLRSFLDLSDLKLALAAFETIASATNEFQALLGTAFDVHKMLENGVDVPAALSFNDLTPLLPPQQLWPFQKMVAADWYLIQIGQDGTGVGYMWGVISQARIGFGIAELVVRGIVLGWFLAQVHHWYQRRYTKFLPTVIYVDLCLAALWTFRDTTGAMLWSIWWALIPFGLIFYFLGLRSEFAPIRSAAQSRPQHSSLPILAKNDSSVS
jgi:hypothetical protein